MHGAGEGVHAVMVWTGVGVFCFNYQTHKKWRAIFFFFLNKAFLKDRGTKSLGDYVLTVASLVAKMNNYCYKRVPCRGCCLVPGV